MPKQKQPTALAVAQEAAILTVAVAIIAAAVYFFLVPSHTSVSSISGFGHCAVQLCAAAACLPSR